MEKQNGMKRVWAGRAVSGLASVMFAMSAMMKLKGGAGPAQMFAHLGLGESLILPIAILELACLVIYLVPRTSVLGAILLTGYMGGAILTHLRVGEPPVIQAMLGILVWLGLYLRESRLRALLPLRGLATAEAAGKSAVAASTSPALGRGNH
jgi:hypothetical protein